MTRIVAITSKLGDIVIPTQALLKREPELTEYLTQLDGTLIRGTVVAIDARKPLPIETIFEGNTWYFEQGELEAVNE